MTYSSPIQTFELAASRVRLSCAGMATLAEAITFERFPPSELSKDSASHLLSAYSVSKPEQLHPDMWEVHPSGDEVLFMCSGAIDVLMRIDGSDARTALDAGQGLIVPKDVWHRLALREPGLIVVLTPRAGTRLSAIPT